MYSHRAKASPLKRLLQGALGLAVLGSGLAFAEQPQGEWKGLVQQANTDVAIKATFALDRVQIHFGEQLSCSVPATLLKESGDTTVYRFGISANGGPFCDGLRGRDLKVTPGTDGRMAIDFPSEKTTWHGDLRQAATTTTQP